MIRRTLARLRAAWHRATHPADLYASMGADDDPWPEWTEAKRAAETKQRPPLPEKGPF